MSLILYTESLSEQNAVGELLDDITIRHPCRAILAIFREDIAPSLEAWVSARCHSASITGQRICCEQITVRSQGQSTKELASAVLPLIIPDLPVVMWWYSGELTREMVEPFLPALDLLIVDSLG